MEEKIEAKQRIINQLECETEPSITLQVTSEQCRMDYNLLSGVSSDTLAFMASSILKIARDCLNWMEMDAVNAGASVEDYRKAIATYLNPPEPPAEDESEVG